jgi:G3E family GTPase
MLLNNPLVTPLFRLDGVTTTIDAVHGMAQLDAHAEAVKQAAVADRLLLTKTDLEPDTAALAARLAQLNPAATLLRVAHGAASADALFGASPSDPARLAPWLALDAYDAYDRDHDAHDRDVNRHDARIRATTLTATAPLDWLAVQAWLADLRARHGPALLRVKGILNLAGEDGPVVVHGVHHVFHPPVRLPRWPDADTRSRLVFILRDLQADAVRAGFPGDR